MAELSPPAPARLEEDSTHSDTLSSTPMQSLQVALLLG